MAAGRPVVASADAQSELAWVVERAKCGWRVPPDDANALTKAIVYAYDNQDEAHRKGQQGRHFVVSHHSRQAVTRQYDALIQQVTNDRV